MAQPLPGPRRLTRPSPSSRTPRSLPPTSSQSAASTSRTPATTTSLPRTVSRLRQPTPPLRRLRAPFALVCLLHADLAAAQPVESAEPEPTEAPTEPAAVEPPAQPAEEVNAGTADPDLAANTAVIARAGLEVDTVNAGPTGPVMLTRLEELGNLELRRAEILPRRAAEDPVVRVRVELRGEQGDTFAILSDVAVSGQSLPGSAREILCTLCTEGEAVERARGELLRLVPFVRARFRPANKPRPVEPPPPVVVPPPDRSLRTLGKAGIGLLAGGAVAVGAGLGLALADPPVDSNNPLRQINLKPAGYAVLGVGAAAIVTGAVLLVLDRRKVRRVAQVAPLIGPGSAGLLLVGRF